MPEERSVALWMTLSPAVVAVLITLTESPVVESWLGTLSIIFADMMRDDDKKNADNGGDVSDSLGVRSQIWMSGIWNCHVTKILFFYIT